MLKIIYRYKFKNSNSLKFLSCSYNSLTFLNVCFQLELIFLYCSYNQLTSLDVTNNTTLTKLKCVGNELTSLDLSMNIALRDLIAAAINSTHWI